MYKDTNEKIERLTEFLAIALYATSIIFVLPFLLYAIVSYYFLDLGKESFYLQFPFW